MATAHFGYAKKLPAVIKSKIPSECYSHLAPAVISKPIGGKSIMHSHNTLPSMAQKYRVPIWMVPALPNLEDEDKQTIIGNRNIYLEKKDKYHAFATDLLTRLEGLDD